jgi:hypothetical protein
MNDCIHPNSIGKTINIYNINNNIYYKIIIQFINNYIIIKGYDAVFDVLWDEYFQYEVSFMRKL